MYTYKLNHINHYVKKGWKPRRVTIGKEVHWEPHLPLSAFKSLWWVYREAYVKDYAHYL